MSRFFVRTAVAVLAALWALSAPAQAPFPARPVRLIVSQPPGGASDLMARVLAEKLGTVWKQTVIVENKAGAAGIVGTDFVAKQPPDGYTFLIGNVGPSAINPLMAKVPYDTAKDFAPMSLIGTAPLIVVVNANAPYKTLQDLIAAEKAKPGSLNIGSAGSGSLAHLAGEMLNHAAGIKIQRVPYKGGILAVNDLLAGQVDLVAADPQAVLPQIKAGKLRAVAVTGPQRFAQLPDVPTVVESGLPELVVVNSWGAYLPAGPSKPVADAFAAGLAAALKDPDLVRRYAELGIDTQSTTGEELRSFNAGEIAKYGKIIKEKNIRPD